MIAEWMNNILLIIHLLYTYYTLSFEHFFLFIRSKNNESLKNVRQMLGGFF